MFQVVNFFCEASLIASGAALQTLVLTSQWTCNYIWRQIHPSDLERLISTVLPRCEEAAEFEGGLIARSGQIHVNAQSISRSWRVCMVVLFRLSGAEWNWDDLEHIIFPWNQPGTPGHWAAIGITLLRTPQAKTCAVDVLLVCSLGWVLSDAQTMVQLGRWCQVKLAWFLCSCKCTHVVYVGMRTHSC